MKLPHTILKGDSKLCPRKLYRGNADLLRFSQRALDAHPHQQRDRAAEPGDPSADARGGDVPGRELCPDAGLRPTSPRGGHPVGLQEIHEHEAFGGSFGRRPHRRLTSFSRSLQIHLRINLDGIAEPHLYSSSTAKIGADLEFLDIQVQVSAPFQIITCSVLP